MVPGAPDTGLGWFPRIKTQQNLEVTALKEILLNKKDASMYLFVGWSDRERGRDRKRESKREVSSIHCFSPQNFHQELGLGQAEARDQELHPGLLNGWQGPKYPVHHLLPFQVVSCVSLGPGARVAGHPGSLVTLSGC